MSRTDVWEQLSDAWHRDECEVSTHYNERTDLFWYGDEDVVHSNVIAVVYKAGANAGEWAVDRYDVAENYLLDDFYSKCTSLDLSPLATEFPNAPP